MPTPNRVSPLPAGASLLRNRYTIDRLLGGGGFGYVYLARDRQGQQFAVKQCTETTTEAVMQFGHELAVLKMLAPNSSHFPKIYEEFTERLPGATTPADPDYSFAVMEFVPGNTLEHLLEERINRRQGPFAENEVTAWVAQLLEALDHAHQRGIIHRDIKPANIMLLPGNKQIKIIDVGIAKIGGSGTKTQRGAAAASAGFAPPEQYAQAGKTDRFTDVYATGATMYALLTAVTPVEAPARISGTQHLLLPRQLNPKLSQRVEEVILRAMEIDVSRRYQSATDMLAALQGKPVAAAVACPACGAANQATARFCLKCGAPLQAQPLILAGMQIQRIDDLIQACDQAWADVVNQLMTSKIDQWLQAQGAPGQQWLVALKVARTQHAQDPNLQLDAFLRQVAPQRQPAQVVVQPGQLSALTVEQGASGELAFQIVNTGQGYLSAVLTCTEPWISVQPKSIRGAGGTAHQVKVTVDASLLAGSRSGKSHVAPIQIKSNGGDSTLLCTVNVTAAPRLNVQPLQVDFGEVHFGQTPARSIHIANDGIGVLTAGIQSSAPWLQPQTFSVNVPSHGRQTVPLHLRLQEVSTRGRYSGELTVDAGAEGGATVQVTIAMDGPFYPSVDSTPIQDVKELINWCDRHWLQAIQLLGSGELFAAARYLGEPTKSSWLRRTVESWPTVLSKVQQASADRNINAGLEQALRALGAEAPAFTTNWREVERQLGLGIMPDARWMMPWWHGPQQVTLRIKNTGRGYLYGQVVSLVGWLAVDAPRFGCFAGQESAITIRVSKQTRTLHGFAPELLDLWIE